MAAVPPHNPISMNPNDLPVLHTAFHLNGKNYLQWAQVIRTTLKGRRKLNHIEGSLATKPQQQAEFWDDDDSIIMTWLWNSMLPEISRNYMFLGSAREIWDTLKQTFSKKEDLSTCYELKNQIFNTKQGSLSVTDYYAALTGLWIELDQYQNLKMECNKDAVMLNKFIERDRIFEFLSGLNPEFDPIRVQVLGKESLPSLSEVFYLIRGEESRRGVMLNDRPSEGSALAVGKKPTKSSKKPSEEPSSSSSKGDRWCSYCKKAGHIKENCFKLHGKEQVLARRGGFKGLNQGKASITMNDAEDVPEPKQNPHDDTSSFKDDLEKLRSLIESLSKNSGQCSFTMSGKALTSHSLNKSSTDSWDTWILDSGATDHMTPYPLNFSSYKPFYNGCITLADGSRTPVSGSGNIQIQSSLPLKNVLHVPKLSSNLISIHKLTRDLNCTITFFPSFCTLQDVATGRTIGTAKEQGGL